MYSKNGPQTQNPDFVPDFPGFSMGYLSIGHFSLVTFVCGIAFGNFSFGCLGALAPGSQAWGTKTLKLGEPGWDNAGETCLDDHKYQIFKELNEKASR